MTSQSFLTHSSQGQGFDAFAIISGVAGEGANDSKTLALQSWLCGYEMTDTLLVITQTGVSMLCTVAKGSPHFQEHQKLRGLFPLDFVFSCFHHFYRYFSQITGCHETKS